MFYKKLKITLQEIDLVNEEEYPLRSSDFAIKRREQKLMMKLHPQQKTTDSQAHTPRQTHRSDIAERKWEPRIFIDVPPDCELLYSRGVLIFFLCFQSELATEVEFCKGTFSWIVKGECSLSRFILDRTKFASKKKIVFIISSHRFCGRLF